MAKLEYWCSEGPCILLKASDTRTRKQWNCPPGTWILNSLPMFCTFVFYLWMTIKLHYKWISVPFFISMHEWRWQLNDCTLLTISSTFLSAVNTKELTKDCTICLLKAALNIAMICSLLQMSRPAFMAHRWFDGFCVIEIRSDLSGQFYRYLLLIAPCKQCNVDANLGLSHLAAGI